MGAGVSPGLQNRWAFAEVKVGGFDSHTLPPFLMAQCTVHGQYQTLPFFSSLSTNLFRRYQEHALKCAKKRLPEKKFGNSLVKQE